MVIVKAGYNAFTDEIYRFRKIKQNALSENAERQGKRQRIVEMLEFLSGQDRMVEEYDEHLVRKLIEKVMVFEDKLKIEFKSGVEIDIEL